MDPTDEIGQLDRSLSDMTSLLLSDGGTELDIEGDFAEVTQPSPPPQASPSQPRADDPAEQIERVQSAVAAALEDVAHELDGAIAEDADRTDRPAGGPTNDTLPPEEPFPESDPVESDPTAPEASALLAAAADDLDALDAEANEDAAEGRVEDAAAIPADDPQPQVAEEPVEPDPEPESRAGPASQPEPPPPPAPAAAPKPAPRAPAPAAPKTAEPTRPPMPSAKERVRAAAERLVAKAGSVLGRLLAMGIEPLAANLEAQPKVIRHSLAWLALWTAFNAGGLWGFLAFFRTTDAKPDHAAMTQITGADAATTEPGPEAAE